MEFTLQIKFYFILLQNIVVDACEELIQIIYTTYVQLHVEMIHIRDGVSYRGKCRIKMDSDTNIKSQFFTGFYFQALIVCEN